LPSANRLSAGQEQVEDLDGIETIVRRQGVPNNAKRAQCKQNHIFRAWSGGLFKDIQQLERCLRAFGESKTPHGTRGLPPPPKKHLTRLAIDDKQMS
jgi:hypothetical protein